MKKKSKPAVSAPPPHQPRLFQYYNSRLYSELPGEEDTPPVQIIHFRPNTKIRFIPGSSESMRELPDNSLHLMVTSRPTMSPKNTTSISRSKNTCNLLRTVFTETYRVLVDGGRPALMSQPGAQAYLPLSDYISRIMLRSDFKCGEDHLEQVREQASHGLGQAGSLLPIQSCRDVHEYILVFSKGLSPAKNRK